MSVAASVAQSSRIAAHELPLVVVCTIVEIFSLAVQLTVAPFDLASHPSPTAGIDRIDWLPLPPAVAPLAFEAAGIFQGNSAPPARPEFSSQA